MKFKRVLAGAAICLAPLVFLMAQEPPQKAADLSNFKWILGTWEAKGPTRTVVERWFLDSAGKYQGMSLIIKGADTSVSETTRLLQDSTGIYFAADVPHNKTEVRFRLESYDSTGARFTNPAHDYPQVVCYQPIGADSLYAWIEGPIGGELKRQEFRYRRVE